MTRTALPRTLVVTPRVEEAWQAVHTCFGRFCLTAGVEALQTMMAAVVEDLCGRRHARSPDRRGHRWGHTRGKIRYQGGKVDTSRAAPLSGSHQCDREHAGRNPPRDKEREALARRLDGSAMGGGRHAGGEDRLPATESYRQLPALRRALAEHQPRRLDVSG